MRVNHALWRDYNSAGFQEARMSANGESHVDGTCDHCGAVGKLGWVVGLADKTHLHACTKPDCRDALERKARETA